MISQFLSQSSLGRGTPYLPILTFSGLSLAAIVWLGLKFGYSSDVRYIPKRKTETKTSPEKPKDVRRVIASSGQHPPKDQVGVSVKEELENAIKECKAKVEEVVMDCKAKNRKFRDIEFDLSNDPYRTLHGLVDIADPNVACPPAVKRVSEIFDQPNFYSNAPGEHHIHQGNLGDCWFLSALSMVATSKELIEKVCVARDEEVGVYGFVFQRNTRWVSVVIDDQLFWSLPAFEELEPSEKELYHDDRDLYTSLTRNTGQGLYHAHSGSEGETWVPLAEKAFAKLHGDFSSLNSGWVGEGVEDLTGGISMVVKSSDILDPDLFWSSELLLTNPPNPSRLMGVSFHVNIVDPSQNPTVQGLYNDHAYAVLRARECKGKKFVVLRNPWGTKEWTGPWSDGSKQWTEGLGIVRGKNYDEDEETKGEWLEVLEELDHVLGDDGEFVMEYKDFLATWNRVEITTLLDSSWIMSSHWLRVLPQPPIHPWAHGDVTFTFTLPYASEAHVVLSQLDGRYYRSISGLSFWGFDFVLYKRGDEPEEWERKGSTYSGLLFYRGVCWHGELEAGEYVVWPRIDSYDYILSGSFEKHAKKWDTRKLSRVLTERTMSRSIASNYEPVSGKRHIPKTLFDVVMEDSVSVPEIREEADSDDDRDATETTTTTVTTEVVVVKGKGQSGKVQKALAVADPVPEAWPEPGLDYSDYEDEGYDYEEEYYPEGAEVLGEEPGDGDVHKGGPTGGNTAVTGENEDERSIWLGLKVYTRMSGGGKVGRKESVVIEGWVKDDVQDSCRGLP